MIPNYDKVAYFYDRLATLVFGNKLQEARIANLDYIRSGDQVLVVGGGSGQLIGHLDQAGLQCHVDFIEVSAAMIRKAQMQAPENITINYIKKEISRYTSNLKYDVIFANFFFDQYDEADCRKFLRHLKSLSQTGTLLLYADFIPPQKAKDKIIKHLMYHFFRLTIGLGKVQLIDHRTVFLGEGLHLIKSKRISSFIISDVYKIA